MLVLGRRRHETVIIDLDGCTVKIKTWFIGRKQVKIAVEAPRDIPIMRGELVQKIGEGQR